MDNLWMDNLWINHQPAHYFDWAIFNSYDSLPKGSFYIQMVAELPQQRSKENWLVVSYPFEKCLSQLGLFFPIYV